MPALVCPRLGPSPAAYCSALMWPAHFSSGASSHTACAAWGRLQPPTALFCLPSGSLQKSPWIGSGTKYQKGQGKSCPSHRARGSERQELVVGLKCIPLGPSPELTYNPQNKPKTGPGTGRGWGGMNMFISQVRPSIPPSVPPAQPLPELPWLPSLSSLASRPPVPFETRLPKTSLGQDPYLEKIKGPNPGTQGPNPLPLIPCYPLP